MKNKCKSLKLVVDDIVITDLKNQIALKRICENFYGIHDEFVLLILQAFTKKEKSLKIVTKEQQTKITRELKNETY